LDRFVGECLRWHRTGLVNPVYELLGDDGELYCRISVKGLLARIGIAEMEGTRLDLRWRMLVRRGVRMTDSDTKEEVGALRLGVLDSGEFVFSAGPRYRFRKSLGRSRISVADDMGEVLFTMTPSVFRPSVKVVLGTALSGRRDLPAMLAATQYALVMMSEETSAALAAG